MAHPSIIRQLLREVAWDGAAIKRYREGGLGYENVLTAEVLQGLDFLPREQFFKPFVTSINGAASTARNVLSNQCESAVFQFLPGPFFFVPSQKAVHTLYVVPDAVIETPDVYAFVEAKRIRSSSFQPEQLAREFVVAVREAKDRTPLLLLILGHEPPVKIQSGGRQEIEDAINDTLATVLEKIESPHTLAELRAMIPDTVAWITWQSISNVLHGQLATFAADTGAPPSVCRAVQRIVDSVTAAIEDHS